MKARVNRVDAAAVQPYFIRMKKTKAKRKYTKRTSKPFTCVIHGAGIDIDIKLDGMNNGLDKLSSALAEALMPKINVVKMDAKPSDIYPAAELSFEAAAAMAAMSTTATLQNIREAITMEISKRATEASVASEAQTNHVAEA